MKNEKAIQEREEIRDLQSEGAKAMFSIDEEDYQERLAIRRKAERLYKEWAKKYPDLAQAEIKKNKQNTYYCVLSEFYSDGTVEATITVSCCKKRPGNKFLYHSPFVDCYTDFFETKDEAEEWRQEALRAPIEAMA